MEKSDYRYRFKKIVKDLSDYIKVINDEKYLTKFLLLKAKENDLQIFLINDCYYIKNDTPNVVLHLNIADKINDNSFINIIDEDDRLNLDTNLNIIEVSSLIMIVMLLESGLSSFDILLTNNRVNDYDKDYSVLKSYLRSNNIINMNLNESNCIAESFASFTLANVDIPIQRLEIDEDTIDNDSYVYRISIKDLYGNRYNFVDIDNVLKNVIKIMVTFLRKLKSKVDLDLIKIDGGGSYASIAKDAFVDIAVKKEFENDLINIFDLYASEFLSSNLRLEPNLKFDLKKLENYKFKPMTQYSYEHIVSFIELALNGAYTVDSNTKTIISSCFLSRVRTINDKLNALIIFRSLSEYSLDEMINKMDFAANVNGAKLIKRLSIPSWQNQDNKLVNVFSKAFDNLFKSNLNVIKTQYSLDCNLIFYKFDVSMISLGVKYIQVDANISTVEFEDYINTYYLIKEVLYLLKNKMERL